MDSQNDALGSTRCDGFAALAWCLRFALDYLSVPWAPKTLSICMLQEIKGILRDQGDQGDIERF
jgi:hypothetical protein